MWCNLQTTLVMNTLRLVKCYYWNCLVLRYRLNRSVVAKNIYCFWLIWAWYCLMVVAGKQNKITKFTIRVIPLLVTVFFLHDIKILKYFNFFIFPPENFCFIFRLFLKHKTMNNGGFFFFFKFLSILLWFKWPYKF